VSQVWFYHLEKRTLESALPELLAKTIDRGWRACVQTDSDERAEFLDVHLWTYDDGSFLPHACAVDPNPEQQPILIVTDALRSNEPQVVFFVDGARPKSWVADEISKLDRCILMINGKDDQNVARAREDWAAAKEAGHEIAYWRQDASGKWDRAS
jgi:DNA polymerase-3 subunit chi